MSHNILKDQAAFSAAQAESALYEVQVLRDAAESIQNSHDCTEPDAYENSAEQIRVLAEVAEEKLEEVMDHLAIVTDYFAQTPLDPADVPARQDSTAQAVFTAIRNVSQN